MNIAILCTFMCQLHPVFRTTTYQFKNESRWNPIFPSDIATKKWLVDPLFLDVHRGSAGTKEPPALEPPLVRDEVVILVGPDKGKTGRVLWVARVDGKAK